MQTPSWLIRGGSDRERLLDMDRRLEPVRLRTLAVLAGALLASGPWVGWWTIVPLLVAAALFKLAGTRIERTTRPEYWMFAAWAGAEAIIALSLALKALRRRGEAGAQGDDWNRQQSQHRDRRVAGLASEPEVAQMATVEFPAAGPEAHQRYRDALERFLPFFAEGRRYSPRGGELPPNVELMAVGGAEVIIFDEVVAGRVSRLPQMLPEILFAALVPFIGPDQAANEMHGSTTGITPAN